MICGACGVDKSVTVEYGITLVRVSPRDGREKIEHRKRRLCRDCGGGLTREETQP